MVGCGFRFTGFGAVVVFDQVSCSRPCVSVEVVDGGGFFQDAGEEGLDKVLRYGVGVGGFGEELEEVVAVGVVEEGDVMGCQLFSHR